MGGLLSASTLCPAKINLFLAVTGRRSDGYHQLVSLVAPVRFGDRLEVRREQGEGLKLVVDGEGVPKDEENLVLRAARRFLSDFPVAGRFIFYLGKRIPAGAGLGGGSSDAVGALRLLNQLLGYPAREEDLYAMACSLGSDCPFFLKPSAAVMRGRGERLEWLSSVEAGRLSGRRLILCKPFPGVSTAWAYRELARAGRYSDHARTEDTLAAWRNGEQPLGALFHNDFEMPVGAKYPGITVLLRELRREAGVEAMMTGSGSACCVFPGEGVPGDAVFAKVREAWGCGAFCVETTIGEMGIDQV